MQRLTRLLSNSSSHQADDCDGLTDSSELVAHRSYSRPKVVVNDDLEISDEMIVRLWIARLRALERFDSLSTA